MLIGEICDVEANVEQSVVDHNQEVEKMKKKKKWIKPLFTSDRNDSERVIRYFKCVDVYFLSINI
jgi:hypothetical protein